MSRRIGPFVAAALLATLVVVGANAAPAGAKNCAGQGSAKLSKPIGLPVVGAKTNVGFTITGNCPVGGGTAFAYGNIASAACGRSTGGTGTINGKNFTFQTVASVGIITGAKVKGVFNAVSDVRKGDSCVSKSADDFLVTSVLTGI